MVRAAPIIRNDITSRTCRFCGQVYPFPAGARECEDKKLPTVPNFNQTDCFRLSPEVFAKHFPKLPEDSNLFAIAGPLFKNRWDQAGRCSLPERTMNLLIKSDPNGHYHEIRVRLVGEASLAERRIIYARVSDLQILSK